MKRRNKRRREGREGLGKLNGCSGIRKEVSPWACPLLQGYRVLLIVQPRFFPHFREVQPGPQLPNPSAALRVVHTRLDLASCGLPDGLVEASSRRLGCPDKLSVCLVEKVLPGITPDADPEADPEACIHATGQCQDSNCRYPQSKNHSCEICD